MKNLTLHIVKKDLRHLWPWLALWWATFVLAAIYPVWDFDKMMRGSEPGVGSQTTSFILLTSLSCIILILVIIALLAEADTPLDDRSFWRTQPVPPSRLLAAKLTFLLAFGLLIPLLIKFITLAAYGFSSDQGWAAFQNFAGILICSNVVLLLAAAFFPRAIIGYAVLIGLLLFALFMVNTFPVLDRASAPPQLLAPNVTIYTFPVLDRASPPPPPPEGFWIPLSLFLAALVATITCLYLHQRRLLALLVLIFCLVLDAALLGRFWAASATPTQSATPPATLPVFTLIVSSDHFLHVTNRYGLKSYFLTGNLSIASLPAHPAEVWLPLWSEWKLSWPNGALTGTSFIPKAVPNPASFPASGYPLRFAEALQPFGVKHLLTTLDDNSPNLSSFSAAVLEPLRQSPPTLIGNLTFAVSRLEEVVRLPLTPGAVSRNPPSATGLISTNLDHASPFFTVTLAEQSPARPNGEPLADATEINLLINPKRGEAVLGYPNLSSVSNDLSDLTLARVDYVFRFQYFTGPGKVYDMPRDEIRAWLADAQFVRLRLVPIGRARGAFTLNPLVIPPNN